MRRQNIWRLIFLLALVWAAGLGVAVCGARAADETLVASGAACRYQVPTSAADGTNWTAQAFNDVSWSLGNSGLGYDTGDLSYVPLFGATVPPGTVSFYVRFAFEVQSATNYSSLTLKVKYDDGFIAYLNGAEVARANVPANAAYDSVAAAGHDDSQALVYQDYDISSFVSRLTTGTNVLAIHALNLGSSSDMLILPELAAGLPEVVTNIVINEFMALNDSTIKNSLGKHGDWIELYNPNSSSISLSGWYLTDDATKLNKWQFPSHSASSIPGKGYLLVWADNKSYSVTNSELHTSFLLNGSGEYLALVKADGVTVVSAYAPAFPQQYADMSYGIGLAGEYRYFAAPTPGSGNAFSSPGNEVAGVKFSPKRGVFAHVVPPVTATTATADAEIRYTTDAELPTVSSPLYASPSAFTHTATLRAAGFKSGWAASNVDTHSYIVLEDVLCQSNALAGWPSSWNGTAADYGMDPSIVSASPAALTNALTFLPTLSVVTPQANLFDPSTGIYLNSGGTGEAWERPASAEWIDTDNSSRFQIDCGLRVQGGYFRDMGATRKKSFSFRFRSQFGDSALNANLFTGNAVSTFNDLVLRAGANDAWDNWGHERTQYIVDEFVRRSHLAMGGISPHGRFAHLYLNGLYWGIYNVTEHIAGEFAAAYCGGRDDTWDVRSQDGALNGDDTAWNAMLDVLASNQGSNATYQRVQGKNPDGTRNPTYPIYLDVVNYIDYMLVEYWSANADWPWNNYRAFRDRNDAVGTGFKFSIWDAEAGLGVWGDLGTDETGSADGVAVIQSRLAGNAEYKLRFADRVQKHVFNGGPLTPEVTIPRYQALAAEIEPAIVAESARWGDQDGGAAHTVAQWRAMRNYVLNTFLPQRPAVFIQQLRNRGLYPAVDAPVFSRFGGLFTNRLSLAVTAAEPIYYTVDGSDPRQYGTGAAAGTLYAAGVPLTLARATRVKARARSASRVWSALTEAVFTPVEKPALRVTELMYHPRKPVSVGGENTLDGGDEFIELQNSGSTALGLAGLHFTQGVAFDFTEGAVTVLNPGDYVLVVKNMAAFTNRYPTVPAQRIAGAFAFPSTSLDNAGGKIAIEDAAGRTVVSFSYNNRWQVATDGAGHSLVPLAGVEQADGELDCPGNWKASVYIGGSPGQAEPAAPAASLVLNEILVHTDTNSPPYDSNDGIELYNMTASPIVLGPGWYLSDDPGDLAKWAIPAATTVTARGWRYFDEMHDFHNPITRGFGLNKAGEQVLLSYLPGTAQGRVVDAVDFRGQENGVSLGRYPDGAAPWSDGVPTPGASNRLTAAGVVIDEVMYHPAPTVANPENNENDEYVELYNPTAQEIGLTNTVNDAGGAWRLAGDIGYVFAPGTVLPAGGRLRVVSFDPVTNAVARDAFLAAYGLTDGQIRLLGPYSGHLNNKTGTVRLERPVFGDPPAPLEDISWHVVDEVTYCASWVVTDRAMVAVPEGGAASFRVRLATQPTGVVAVAVSRTAGVGDITVSGGASLTFDPGNWDTYQTVTLAATEDGIISNGDATITCSAAGFVSVNVTATKVDNDAVVKAKGGTVVNYTLDGSNYAAHIFSMTGSSSFTPIVSPLSVEYLVIGGGGGGGLCTRGGGGGGAGGYRSSVAGEFSGGGAGAESPIVLGARAYTITIGAGGAGNANEAGGRGESGGNSSISGLGIAAITAAGGAGGAGEGQNAVVGGSGGGDDYSNNDGSAGASGQGYAGGSLFDITTEIYGGGGGGGAGEPGGTDGAGQGGGGLPSRITGSPVLRAGGGGAGALGMRPAGGDGGGAAGNGGNGSDHAGGGGGGSYAGLTGGHGGSGIVVIRYVIPWAAGTYEPGMPVFIKRLPAANPAAISEGASLAFSVTADDSADRDEMERGMSNITWYVDGVRVLETKAGAPAAISSAFTLRTATDTVVGAASRNVEVRAVALDRQGDTSATNWTVCVSNVPASQTVTFRPLPVTALGATNFSPGATASSGLPVAYTSAAPAVAQIENGLLHVTGAGTAVITAVQPGNFDFKAAAPVKQTLTVKARLTAEVSGGGGTVSGAGLYLPGTKVPLTAMPALNNTFLRWEDGSQTMARSLVMPNANTTVSAWFGITTNVPKPVIADPGAKRAMVGVPFTLALDIASDSQPAVTVTGLPSGLAYVAVSKTVAGVPTASVTNRTVTITAKNVNVKSTVRTFTLTVDPLPAWAQGSFNGAAGTDALGSGAASMSVTALGVASGKLTLRGTNFAFSAKSYLAREGDGSFTLATTASVGKVAWPLTVAVNVPEITDTTGAVPVTLSKAEGVLNGDGWATLYRNVWKDAGMAAVATNYTGYYTAVLPSGKEYGSGYLTFTVDKLGGVKTTGKLADGAAVSLAGTLVLDEAGRVFAMLYTAPAAYNGGGLFGLAEFVKGPERAKVFVRLLDGIPLAWYSLNPNATQAHGLGFSRDLGLTGGWYDTLGNLYGYYSNRVMTVSTEGSPVPEILVGTNRYDSTWWDPDGLALTVVTNRLGVLTALTAPTAGMPVKAGTAFEYAAPTNAVGLTISLTRATGVFKGAFNAWFDYAATHTPRTISYEGVLTPERENPDDGVAGRGYFLWADTSQYLNPQGKPVPYSFSWSYDLKILLSLPAP